ncbi:MAG: aminotransferase class I/II-fold pyridoxal phosphate-dependent enzyme [Alphaproteobacteria bacterium]|nr:aminotransferase class I/II-fold pyridoxal phosphate-dependent enzyme [Alphaproteobacteria bacterium]MCB9928216.1 aminotransferase class I/II-fold pyridoxal phosphate-dependent enzyme [Alphaproteobacteria bacterium]
MPDDRLKPILAAHLASLEETGTRKGAERVIRGVLPPAGDLGPRYLLEGQGDRPFLRMNANSYLGLSSDPAVIAAEEHAVRTFGAGPGAVRFISGTWVPHRELERRLAAFHGREAAMLFSSAYATVMGLLPSLITPETAVISDELNHNCIINAIRLSTPREKRIYRHLAMAELEEQLQAASQTCRRAIIVTDGIFSMRGDHAPLDRIMALARRYDEKFAENVLVVVDDSHGIGALGRTGRGTEEATASGPADLLVATLGKAFGVNGGYVVGSDTLIAYLRETAPFYIYSNPITPAEAAAAAASLTILESPRGLALLEHLRAMTTRFERGLLNLGHEIIPSAHPVTPLLVRDTPRTRRMIEHLFAAGILATGLGYPVVPRGDEEIRFQIAADHTPADIDAALDAVRTFDG